VQTRFRSGPLLAFVLAATPCVAGDDLGALLQGIAPGKRPQGDVAVSGWVERGSGGTELVVRVEPRGAAKLVAEPGVVVTPLSREGVSWPAYGAQSELTGHSYFETPVELRLPVRITENTPVEADVEYAYCLVDYQCLFGTTRLVAQAPACHSANNMQSC
jgi:hypothetical protein